MDKYGCMIIDPNIIKGYSIFFYIGVQKVCTSVNLPINFDITLQSRSCCKVSFTLKELAFSIHKALNNAVF